MGIKKSGFEPIKQKTPNFKLDFCENVTWQSNVLLSLFRNWNYGQIVMVRIVKKARKNTEKPLVPKNIVRILKSNVQ